MVAHLLVFAVLYTSPKENQTSEEIKLIKGEISTFQYCAHIGKAAVNDTKCKEFNLRYGPQ